MESLYEDLGATPGDSRQILQQRYRQRARALHPDVNGDPGAADAMRRLNHAWAVLGDPRARRAYDDTLGRPPSGPTPPAPGPFSEPAERPGQGPEAPGPVAVPWPWKLIRPSVLIPLVLVAIFVGTAYAGHVVPDTTTPATTVATTLSPALPVGRCVTRQVSGLTTVPCAQANDGQVAAEVKLPGQCPPGTVAAPDPAFAAVACLKPLAP